VISSTSKEDISDFSLTASVRHSFYWMHIGGEKNYIRFAPQLSLSMMLNLRPEYYFGKFFIQPQLILDYYLPASEFAALFALNAGIILH
jgi:hypothetical protein